MTRPDDHRDRGVDGNKRNPGRDVSSQSPGHTEVGDLPDPFALAEMARTGLLDVVPGQPPVPINIWRITDVDSTHAGPGDGLTPLLAVLLLGVFTGPGDLVVDLTDDPALADTARAGARRYLPLGGPTDLIDLATPIPGRQRAHRIAADPIKGQARLTFLHWPLPTGPETNTANTAPAVTAAEVFPACRHLLAADGCIVVALAPTAAQLPYIEHSELVIPAAYQSGLGYLQHIIVVATMARTPRTIGAADGTDQEIVLFLNLLVFSARGGCRG